METTFANITKELEIHCHNIEQCKKLVLDVIHQDPYQLPDPDKLCRALRNTDYFKKETIYEFEDYFQLHELHPIHLLLSLKESPELYIRLYDLYQFQNTFLESTRDLFINKYKNDPEVTAKQIEILAFNKPLEYISDHTAEFMNTLYMKYKINALKNESEPTPWSILNKKNFMHLGLMTLQSDSLPQDKAMKLKQQAILMIENNAIDYIAIELELLSHTPLYLSNQLEKRNKKILHLADIFNDKEIPGYLKEEVQNFQKTLLRLKPGLIIKPETSKIDTAVKFTILNDSIKATWEKLNDTFKSSGKDFNNKLLLSNKLDTTDLNSFVSSLNNTHDYFISNPPPIHFVLEFPKEATNCSESTMKNFINDFLIELEIADLACIAFAYKKNGINNVEVLAQRVHFERFRFRPVGFETMYIQAQKILPELEQKYGIMSNISHKHSNNKNTRQHILDNLKSQEPLPKQKNKKGLHP